jgi:hypothetical protein
VFSDLPAIFAREITQDGLQVEQHVLVDFGASKAGTQTLMQVVQARDPGANRPQGGLGWLGCGMLMMLHADLLSQRGCNEEEMELLACHIGARTARRYFWFRGSFQGEFRGQFLAFKRGTKVFSTPGNLQGEFRGKILPFQVPL